MGARELRTDHKLEVGTTWDNLTDVYSCTLLVTSPQASSVAFQPLHVAMVTSNTLETVATW